MKNIIEDIQNLDPNNPGLWPIHFQIGLGVIVLIALIYAGWHFDLSKQREALVVEEVKEVEHKEVFDLKQRRAANLDALKEQMIEMEQSFGDMIRQLPNQTEIAGLIVDVSQTGLSAGLEFDLFQPRPEQPAEFYARLPINIKVNGTYHQFGEFISGIAQLPRIVTTHDINITKTEGNTLNMSAVAMTYRALGEDE
ncbi:MAG: type 4a pilus biogenesis protein PilO [Gammaproteobacteria bacterium]|nr:type 4a pilus biogenesis protein PilO [Gammaproteobacteria bacterium]